MLNLVCLMLFLGLFLWCYSATFFLPYFDSIQSACRTRSSRIVSLAWPSVYFSLQITNCFFSMHHLNWGIIFLLHSANLILFTVYSPPGSPRLAHIYLPLPQPFTPDLNTTCFTDPFLHSFFLAPFGLPSQIMDWSKWALAFQSECSSCMLYMCRIDLCY